MSGFASAIGNFFIGESPIGSQLSGAPYAMLSQTIGSYLYFQYQDDPTLPAFIEAYNAMTQTYVTWFNTINLPVWTSPTISGPLLDWVANGIYGIPRPVLTTSSSSVTGPIATFAIATNPIAARTEVDSGTATIATDDIYKRVMTWNLYKGDGMQFTTAWLKRRIARFLAGQNGVDPGIEDTFNVSIAEAPGTFTITLPTGGVSVQLQQCFANNVLSLPFQYTYEVYIGLSPVNSGLSDNGGVLNVLAPATGYPTSTSGLAAGSIWSNNGVVSVVPGVTPNPSAPAVYFGQITASQLLTLGGGNLPTTQPGISTGQLWNNGDEVCIA